MRALSLAAAAALLIVATGAGAPVRAFADTPAAAAPDARPLQFGRFTVEVTGKGPDVILIPGLGSSRETWEATAATLSSNHTVHRIQIAGFAGTPAGDNAKGEAVAAPTVEALAAYIEAKGLKRPAVIGHSLGGESALMLAARHPNLVSRLMIVDAYPFYSLLFSPTVTVEMVKPQATMFRDRMAASDDAAWAASSKQQVQALVSAPERQAQVAGWMIASDRPVVARAFYELMTTDLRPDLGAITAPVTVVYAHNSYIPGAPESYDARIADMYAGVKSKLTLVRVDDSRHFVMFDQPERFASTVAAFLKD